MPSRRRSLLAIALWSCLPALPGQAAEFTVNIGRSASSQFPAGSAAPINEMLNAIVDGDEHTGVDCDLAFSVGDNRVIQVPDSVDTASQLQELFAMDGVGVIVVRFLNYCGTFNPAYSGCSDDNLPIVVDNQIGLDGSLAIQTNAILWLHEFGHSQGLGHSSATNGLMNPTVTAANMRLTQAQCNSLRTSDPAFPSPQAAIVPPLTQVQLAVEALSPLELLLSGAWTHGIPVEDLRALGSSPADLERILLDPGRSSLWPNAVLALGMIGEEPDIKFLVFYYDFLIGAGDDVSVQSARANVPFAVGLLSGRFNSTEGVSFLASLAVPPSGEAGQGSFTGLDEVTALQVGKNALVGLALSPVGEPDNEAVPGPGLGARAEDLRLPADFQVQLQELAIDSRAQGIENLFGVQAPE